MSASSKLLCFIVGQLLLSSFAKTTDPPVPEVWKSGCTAWLNSGTRNCCPSTGLCQDSSCVVFGFKNSEKANCNGDCDNVQCNYAGTSCTTKSDGKHCYGTVVCKAGKTCVDSDLVGSLCLEDGSSDNFKICGNATDCKKDDDCEDGHSCNGDKCATTPDCKKDDDCEDGNSCIDDKCATSPSPSLSASPSPSLSASPSPSAPPDGPINPDGGPINPGGDPCKPCDDNYRTAECQDEVKSHKGWFVADIPECTELPEETFKTLTRDYGCAAKEGCTTYVCDTFIPEKVIAEMTTCQPSIIPSE